MIKFFDTVPTVYASASRDFQYLGWLIDIVLNDVKHNVDNIYNLPANTNNPKLTELLTSTLGFKAKRNYDQVQLMTIIKILPLILRYKGSIKAFEIICEAILHTTGTFGITKVDVEKPNLLKIQLPKELKDTTLLVDLLPYILPAGMTYRIIPVTEDGSHNTTEIEYGEFIISDWKPDIALSSLFDASKVKAVDDENITWPYYSSYLQVENEQDPRETDNVLNPGVLYKTLTPALNKNHVWTPKGNDWINIAQSPSAINDKEET